MAWCPPDQVAHAGRWVLEALKERPSVRFSEVFTFDPQWGDSGPFYDVAIGQLEERGFVRTTVLPSEMPDGEQDYLVELTESGREFLASGRQFEFVGMEL